MEKLLEAHNGKVLQSIVQLYKLLKEHGKSIEDVEEYLKQRNLQTRRWKYQAKTCPKCNTSMLSYHVNSNPRNQIGGDWRSQWICPKCGEELFDKRSPEEIFDERV